MFWKKKNNEVKEKKKNNLGKMISDLFGKADSLEDFTKNWKRCSSQEIWAVQSRWRLWTNFVKRLKKIK